MFVTKLIIKYFNGEKKVIENVIAIHKRRNKLWIHTKNCDHFIDNKEIMCLFISTNTLADYQKLECFDASLDCPVKPYHTEDYDGETQ